MNKRRMPKNREKFEKDLINAFDIGMQSAYSVEHTEKSYDEEILRNRYKAMIQGKSTSMSTIIDGEKTINEILSGI